MNRESRISVAFRGTLGRFDLDAAFEVPARGVTALFGPSGCGKTTVLRCIAGLARLPGQCRIGQDTWQDQATFRPAHRRPVGYVFQEASLFPHLSVRGNLLYGAGRRTLVPSCREKSTPAEEGDTAQVGFAETVDLLGLAKLLDRAPRHLSGGERQRVAIGRALLSRPRLLLMDEPLSALDRPSRDEILPFLERLNGSLAIPILYVSHDMGEVERLADTLVLMDAGRVRACGPLPDLQSDPALPLAAERDAAVSLEATVAAVDPVYGLTTLRIEGADLLVPGLDASIGTRRRLRVAAGDVSLSRTPVEDTTILNCLPVRIETVSLTEAHQMVVVLRAGHGPGGATLLARVTRRSWERLRLEPGLDVYALVKSVALLPTERPA